MFVCSEHFFDKNYEASDMMQCLLMYRDSMKNENASQSGGGGGGGGIGYQVSDITSTKCSFGYFSLDTPTPFAVLTVFLDNT